MGNFIGSTNKVTTKSQHSMVWPKQLLCETCDKVCVCGGWEAALKEWAKTVTYPEVKSDFAYKRMSDFVELDEASRSVYLREMQHNLDADNVEMFKTKMAEGTLDPPYLKSDSCLWDNVEGAFNRWACHGLSRSPRSRSPRADRSRRSRSPRSRSRSPRGSPTSGAYVGLLVQLEALGREYRPHPYTDRW